MSFFFPLNRTCIGTYSVRIVLFGLGKEKRREERVLQYTPDWEQRKKKYFFLVSAHLYPTAKIYLNSTYTLPNKNTHNNNKEVGEQATLGRTCSPSIRQKKKFFFIKKQILKYFLFHPKPKKKLFLLFYFYFSLFFLFNFVVLSLYNKIFWRVFRFLAKILFLFCFV